MSSECLAIQKFLRSHSPKSAVAKAVEKFGLKVSEVGDLVQFNYDITSTRGIPETDECRGLILERPSWRIIAYPLYRFYNHHEGYAAKVDFDKSVLTHKLDGTLIIAYPYHGETKVATRGMIFAHGGVGRVYDGAEINSTFAELFWDTINESYSDAVFPPDLCIMLELTTPENRVVTPYFNRSLHILAARRTSDWQELEHDELNALSEHLGIPRPKVYEFKNRAHINSMISALPTLEEGFVLTDYSQVSRGSFARIKIKNPKYLAAAHLVGSGFNPKKVLEIVLQDGEAEFVSYFPDYTDEFAKVRIALEELVYLLEQEYDAIKHLCADPKDKAQRKAFAAEAQKSPCPHVLFRLLSGHVATVHEGLKSVADFKIENLYRVLCETTLRD